MSKITYEFKTCNTPDGFSIDSIETNLCKCTWVEIQNGNGEAAMGKSVGNYITIETSILENGQRGNLDEIAKTVSEYLVKIMNISDDDSVLVVGVGNRSVLADSLGVRTVDKICVTRHVIDETNGELGTNLRPVSAIAPGVMGVTGLNTAEIIKSITDEVNPSLVIVIDALAARKSHRICTTIQISDTGLTPSSGIVGKNKKQTINAEYLGRPVISIGIPTVINAANIVTDVLGLLLPQHDSFTSQGADGNTSFGGELIENIRHYTDELFSESSPFVTPKEIDATIHYSAYIISTAINIALFGNEWMQLTHNSY